MRPPFVRHARSQTDRAISCAYNELFAETAAAFTRLLTCVRACSRLLDYPRLAGSRHLQVEALRNLARFEREWLRPVETWAGERGSMYEVVDSLAHHLLAEHRVPRFLSSVWYEDDRPLARTKRGWFIDHARGQRFRSLALPMQMTRQMEHLFLGSPDHLTVEQAMRRAELLALGGSDALVAEVSTTRLGSDLRHGDFWRTVMAFFVRVQSALDLTSVGPIVDFIQFLRHEHIEVETLTGIVRVAPPEPEFSMKGRTLQSTLRLVDEWHRRLGRAPTPRRRWPGSRYRPMVVTEPSANPEKPVVWEVVELTNSADLKIEGASLHHCVASYAHYCLAGRSRIWSLRRRGERSARSLVTIEVNPRTRTIVQARGFRNRPASGRNLDIIRAWARRENLRLAV